MGGAADGRIGSGDLVLGGIVHIDDRLILVADIFDHIINVDAQQVGGADQQHADGQHAHRGKGHKPVGTQIVQALTDKVGKAGKTHGVPSLIVKISLHRSRNRPLPAGP